MRARENMSDVESEDPTKVGNDMIFSEEEESQEVIVTSVEPHDPMAMSAGGEQEAERHSDVPTPRKDATSSDAIGERQAKRTRLPCPSEASSALPPPTPGMAVQAGRSEERVRTPTSSGPAPARDP